MWEAIADSRMRERCWNAIEEIATCLVADGAGDDAPGTPRHDAALASGEAGLALFFAYLDAAGRGTDAGEHALAAVGRSLDLLAAHRALPDLYIGFCGVGWVLEHLTRELFEGDDELADDIDEALARLLAEIHEPPPFELIGGLAGFGTYLVERLPHPRAAASLVRVVDLLAARAEETDAGITWFTLPAWLSEEQREQMPEGCYNFGVAHGVPGVIGFLAAAWREGIDDPRIPHLAAGAVRWLLANRLSRTDVSAFPAYVAPGQEPAPTRTAWCYGDLGIAAVLLAAARSFGRADWEAEALALARGAASRSLEVTQAIDPGLCHGSVGLAHLFNRLYQATGDPEMKTAALTWYGCALDLRRPGEGLAGLLSWVSPGPGQGSWRRERGFLTGIAGYGLAMLGAVSEREPAWDRVMLVAVPPRAAAVPGGGAG